MSQKLRNTVKCWVRRLLLFALVCVFMVGAYALYVFVAHHNFHTVSAGLVYRSAQMDGPALAAVVREHGIKSILNLRGAADGKDWYDAEINTSRQLGVQHFDYALSASRELEDEEMDRILATIRNAPKPILIHCKAGADRTGLVGALYLYSLEGVPAQTADRQLTILYGHAPHWFWGGTIAMDNSFWRYVRNHAPQPKLAKAIGTTGESNESTPLARPDLAHAGTAP